MQGESKRDSHHKYSAKTETNVFAYKDIDKNTLQSAKEQQHNTDLSSHSFKLQPPCMTYQLYLIALPKPV